MTSPHGPADASHDDGDDDASRPLVMERLRRIGWLPVVLAPLLVVTLAQTVVSRQWAIIVFIGGLVAITAWSRRDDDR